ncbi:hypothetical protein T4E_11091 [Trichinella pseudospiralis]|uniref:Retrovirus-related Pol polyprotein from transposon TNT 1-94 n=1 Tax=Trichinella pseudospiralis TaxID=6337 RepID=A0A0V0YHU4_TRIPS|nr:hypothetical protein T4E_11091 [Trichinella pseudospiralis]
MPCVPLWCSDSMVTKKPAHVPLHKKPLSCAYCILSWKKRPANLHWSPTIDRSVFVSNHIDIKHHFVKEEVQEGKLEIRQIPSGGNAGDMIAKALMPSRLVACVKLIRIAA